MNRCIHEQIQESVHNYIPGQIRVQLHYIYVAVSVHSHIFALRLHLELRCSDMRLHCGHITVALHMQLISMTCTYALHFCLPFTVYSIRQTALA